MKTNFKLSSKMHLFIIISVVIVAIGAMVGTICQFVANGYFNYGDDWSNYYSVTVSYEYVDFSSREEVDEMCQKGFSEAGVKQYTEQHGTTSTGETITYKFTTSTDLKKLQNAEIIIKAAIDEKCGSGITLSSVSVHNGVAKIDSSKALTMSAIAIAAIIAFHFVYFIIRYKLSMAFAALLADVHNLALYVSLLSLTRIPVGTSVFAFAVLTLLVTVIGTCFLFDRMRKNFKNEDLSKLTAFEQVDLSASECFKVNVYVPACLAVIAAVLFVLLAISSLSSLAIISPVLCALVSLIVSVYGTVMFV
ncbi:MAG: hypothetical protein HDP34_00500, partial [Clostridia bacterium]|nr:hypothetical protein [Clostridia bacterium]